MSLSFVYSPEATYELRPAGGGEVHARIERGTFFAPTETDPEGHPGVYYMIAQGQVVGLQELNVINGDGVSIGVIENGQLVSSFDGRRSDLILAVE